MISWIFQTIARVRSIFSKSRLDREIEEELATHIEIATDENIRSGMDPITARRVALLRMGSRDAAMQLHREARGVFQLEIFCQDIRYAVRSLRQSSWLTAAVITTITLAIGVNTALFSAIHAVILKALPYRSPDRLVWITASVPGLDDDVAFDADVIAWRSRSRSLETIAAMGVTEDRTLVGYGEPAVVRVTYSSESVGRLLGASPAIGRDFVGSDFTITAEPVALLSDRFFRRFSGDESILGTTINLGGEPVRIVGVLPAGFRFPLPSPFASQQSEPDAILSLPLIDDPRSAGGGIYQVIGRLKDGVRIEAARAELEAIRNSLPRPPEIKGPGGVRVIPLHQRIVGDVRRPLLFLWLGAGFILLVACANVANLLLARSANRSREIAVRLALGAGRMRIMRAALMESLALALAGGAAGVLVAFLSLRQFLNWLPFEIPRLRDSSLNMTVLVATLGACVLTGIACGILPALMSSRLAPAAALKDRSRASQPGRGVHWQNLFTTSQLAFALLLLTGAGLALKSLWLMHSTSAAFSPEKVLVLMLDSRQATEKAHRLRDLVQGVEAVPGVETAAVWNPGHQQAAVRFQEIADLPPTAENVADVVHVSSHLLTASGIQLRAGRWIDDMSDASARTAVVNLALQRRYKALLPTPEAAIGKSFRLGSQQFVIAGVVSDFRPRPDLDAKPMVYLPLGEFPNLSEVQLLVRSSANPSAISGAVREIVGRKPEITMTGTQTLAELMSGPIAPRRFEAGLLGAFAALALVLALVGVYGVVNYSVSERTQELGVRIALGATPQHVLRIVLKRIVTIVAAGSGVGIVGSLSLGRLMETLVYGVKPTDTATYVTMSSMLIAAAALAAYVPARRALRIDPIESLRHEG